MQRFAVQVPVHDAGQPAHWLGFPLGHEHVPPMQTDADAGHVTPQPPQLLLSFCSSTQTPLQVMSFAGQMQVSESVPSQAAAPLHVPIGPQQASPMPPHGGGVHNPESGEQGYAIAHDPASSGEHG